MKDSNEITILRKRTVANIPGFYDDETGNPQNTWFRVADFECVEVAPAQTARVYDLEHNERNKMNDDTAYVEFNFESVRQTFQPPYDIQSGDYVGFWQGTTKFLYRVVKSSITQMFHNCCIIQLVCNVTQPKEAEYLLECGRLRKLADEDINEGSLPIGEEDSQADTESPSLGEYDERDS